jgi:hypothetical protein
VFICDGTRWIWNWVEDEYPGSVQVPDFYHALEKLIVYAGLQFCEQAEATQWLQEKNKPCSAERWHN